MKKILVLLIAVVMITSMSITAFGASAGWHQDGYGWWYQNADGSYPAGTWQNIDGSWYHFNNSGYMQTGWIYDGGSWYFLLDSGVMAVSWQYIGGEWYYMDPSGAMYTGWLLLDDCWYYLDADGVMATGVRYIDGVKYVFSDEGVFIPHADGDEVAFYLYDDDYYYYDGYLFINGGIINLSGKTLYDIYVDELEIINDKGTVAYAYDYGELEDVVIGPYETYEELFFFYPDEIYQPGADLGKGFLFNYSVEYDYY